MSLASEPARPGRPLDGRVVAVTGAGRGLGLLTVRELVDQGARVLANHRSPSEDLEQLSKEHPGQVHLLPGDISEEPTAVALLEAARKLGRLDALVNNAGITRDRVLMHLSVEDWDEVQRVNLRGPFLATKHALKLMIRQRSGRIVYISSIVAEMGNAGQAAYAASKAGLHGLARTVAQEYSSYNIRTVVLAPGVLDTGLVSEVPVHLQERKIGQSLAGLGSAADIASTVAFLVSPRSEFINATVLRADGGVRY